MPKSPIFIIFSTGSSNSVNSVFVYINGNNFFIFFFVICFWFSASFTHLFLCFLRTTSVIRIVSFCSAGKILSVKVSCCFSLFCELVTCSYHSKNCFYYFFCHLLWTLIISHTFN